MSDPGQILLLALMLILPLAALIARKPPLGQTIKLAAIWVALFALAAVVVTLIDRMRSGPAGDPTTTIGQTTRISRAADGHYWVDAQINGVTRRMLVDSGATTTAVSAATAVAAGVGVDRSSARIIETANGAIVANTARIERLTIGSIETRDLPVIVATEMGEMDLLGMNFLTRLGSWRVEDDTLILDPPS